MSISCLLTGTTLWAIISPKREKAGWHCTSRRGFLCLGDQNVNDLHNRIPDHFKGALYSVNPISINEITKGESAVGHKLRTIAFPAISTGIFGFPIDRCAKIMITTASEYLAGDTQIDEVIFCLYTSSDFEVFEKELK